MGVWESFGQFFRRDTKADFLGLVLGYFIKTINLASFMSQRRETGKTTEARFKRRAKVVPN